MSDPQQLVNGEQHRQAQSIVEDVYRAAATLARLTHMTQSQAMRVLDLIVERDQDGLRFEYFERVLSRPNVDPMTGQRRHE